MSDDANDTRESTQAELVQPGSAEVEEQEEMPRRGRRLPRELLSEDVEAFFLYDEEHTLEVRESEVDSLIPSEKKLAGIEKHVQGGADRFLTMIEENGKHRRRMNAGRLVRSFAGLASGLVVALYCLGLSAQLILAGHDVAGGVLGSVDLVALTTVFVIGRKTATEDDASEEDAPDEDAE